MTTQTLELEIKGAKTSGKSGRDDDDDKPAEGLETSPLFASLGDEFGKVDHIVIERIGPVREGQLERLDPEATEEDIIEQHGGGKFRLQARQSNSKPLKGGFRTVILAGDPIFKSEHTTRMWRRQTGQPVDAGGAQQLGVQDLIALITQASNRAGSELEARQAAQEAQHQRELARLKLEMDMREQARQAEHERHRVEAQEREDQRRRENDERDERRRKEDETSRERDRTFQATLLQITSSQTKHAPGPDPTSLLLAGVELAQKLGGGGGGGGGGDSDPVSSLVTQLPAIIDKLSVTLKPGAAAAASSDLTIAGDLGKKGAAVVAHLQAQGMDPEQALSKMFDVMMQMRKPAASPAAAATAQPRRGAGGRVMPVPIPRDQPAPTTPAPAAPAPTAPDPAPATSTG